MGHCKVKGINRYKHRTTYITTHVARKCLFATLYKREDVVSLILHKSGHIYIYACSMSTSKYIRHTLKLYRNSPNCVPCSMQPIAYMDT